MFSKLSNKTLVIVLLVLGVVFYFAVYSDHSNSSYKNELINLDTAGVTKIKIEAPDKAPFELTKNNNLWNLQLDNNQADADLNKIKALLTQMSPLKTIRVATNSQKDFDKYGVGDKALKINFLDGNKSLAVLYLGKVHYEVPEEDERNPYSKGTQGRLIGYARTDGDNLVYVVDGYMKISYGDGADSFKKKTLLMLIRKPLARLILTAGALLIS